MRFLGCWLLLFFIHYFSIFLWCFSSFIAFRCHPSPFRELLLVFYTHFIFSAQLIAECFTRVTFWPLWVFLLQFVAIATNLREPFSLWRDFYLTLLPEIWHNLLLSRLPWEPAVLPWKLQGLPLSFKTQTWLICLFELHSVHKKALVGRLRLASNEESASYGIWTLFTIDEHDRSLMFYLLGYRAIQSEIN